MSIAKNPVSKKAPARSNAKVARINGKNVAAAKVGVSFFGTGSGAGK